MREPFFKAVVEMDTSHCIVAPTLQRQTPKCGPVEPAGVITTKLVQLFQWKATHSEPKVTQGGRAWMLPSVPNLDQNGNTTLH